MVAKWKSDNVFKWRFSIFWSILGAWTQRAEDRERDKDVEGNKDTEGDKDV